MIEIVFNSTLNKSPTVCNPLLLVNRERIITIIRFTLIFSLKCVSILFKICLNEIHKYSNINILTIICFRKSPSKNDPANTYFEKTSMSLKLSTFPPIIHPPSLCNKVCHCYYLGILLRNYKFLQCQYIHNDILYDHENRK